MDCDTNQTHRPAPASLPTLGASAVTSDTASRFITFTLGDAEFGIDIMLVREIKGWTHPTALPKAPPYMRGVINLRGVIVPILDLRARFGMGLTEPSPTHVVIMVTAAQRITGLLVDAVSDIISVAPDMVRPVPDVGTSVGETFLDGLAALGDRMVTLVSLDGLVGAQGAEARA